MKTFAFPAFGYFFIISRSPFLFSKYSLEKVVSCVESIIIFSGKSVKIAEIMILLSPSFRAVLLISSLSILTIPLLSLKNISRASKTVDFPISFFPTKTVRLSISILISFLYP